MATEKFKAMVHFVVHECRDNPSKLGAVRLNKALWHSDVLSYRITGQSISGDKYVRRQKGPVPAHILQTLSELQKSNALHIEEPRYQFEPRKYFALTPVQDDVFSDLDKEIIRTSIGHVCGLTADKASDETHDVIWEAAQDGEEIPLNATLASIVGTVTPEMAEWALDSIQKS